MFAHEWKRAGGKFCLDIFMAALPFASEDNRIFSSLERSVLNGVADCFSRRQLYAVSELLMNSVDQICKLDDCSKHLLGFCFAFLEKCRKTPGYRRLLDHVMDCVMRTSTSSKETYIWFLVTEFASIVVDEHLDSVKQWVRRMRFSRDQENAHFALLRNNPVPWLQVSEDDLLMLARSDDEHVARYANSLPRELPGKTPEERRNRGNELGSMRQCAALFLFYQQCTVYDIPLGKQADCVRSFLCSPLLPFYLKIRAVCVVAGSTPPPASVFDDVKCIYPFLR
jgi:hypothetical protein